MALVEGAIVEVTDRFILSLIMIDYVHLSRRHAVNRIRFCQELGTLKVVPYPGIANMLQRLSIHIDIKSLQLW